MKLTKNLILGGLLIGSALGSVAHATTLETQSFKSLVHGADVCVIGSVASTSTEVVDGQVYTVTEFNVSKVGFGDTGRTVSVTTMGGALTKSKYPIKEVVPGSPQFLNGQDYFLLLDASSATGDYAPAGTFQGVLPVYGGQVNLPGIGAGLSVDDALDVVSTERAAPTAEIEE